MALLNRFVGAFVAGSLFASSAMAGAATTATPAQSVNPWAALTAMTAGAPAATMCGAAAATAQAPGGGCVLPAVDAPPATPVAEAGPPAPVPVPPIAAPAAFGFNPLLLALAAIAIGVGVYFAARGGGNNGNSPG